MKRAPHAVDAVNAVIFHLVLSRAGWLRGLEEVPCTVGWRCETGAFTAFCARRVCR